MFFFQSFCLRSTGGQKNKLQLFLSILLKKCKTMIVISNRKLRSQIWARDACTCSHLWYCLKHKMVLRVILNLTQQTAAPSPLDTAFVYSRGFASHTRFWSAWTKHTSERNWEEIPVNHHINTKTISSISQEHPDIIPAHIIVSASLRTHLQAVLGERKR